MVHKWSDYQSLLQLSIGFNAAYISVTQFLAADVPAQERLVKAAMEFANQRLPNENEIRGRLQNLYGEILGRKQTDKSVLDSIGIASILFFVLGFGVLFYASIYADREVDPTDILIFCIFSVLPFLFGVLYMAIHSTVRFQGLARRRQAIEDEMTNMLQASRLAQQAATAPKPSVQTPPLP